MLKYKMIHFSDMREWGLISILLAATLAFSVIASKSYPRTRPTVNRNVRLSRPALPPIAPMRWDDYEGAYMASLVVGIGVVELVLDTGSSQLSVKGPNCTWRHCGDTGCSVSACPCGFLEGGTSFLHLGVVLQGRALVLIQLNPGRTSALTFAARPAALRRPPASLSFLPVGRHGEASRHDHGRQTDQQKPSHLRSPFVPPLQGIGLPGSLDCLSG